ncbi:cupin domain-containing protein [Glutamicibacter sp. NPDC087344]|uniref:cupin domain-containing protein n=1 Tax=Glutamicibacter sp. NPDC087344 TaxID=3363994 RepID=UPI0037F2FF19
MSAETSTMPQVQILSSVGTALLADLVLKPTALNGTTPSDATDNAITLNAGTVDIGFWACSPGTFKTARNGVNEVILVLEGSGTLVADTGERVDHAVGDMVLIPNGWSGVWEIHEQFKKQYITLSV